MDRVGGAAGPGRGGPRRRPDPRRGQPQSRHTGRRESTRCDPGGRTVGGSRPRTGWGTRVGECWPGGPTRGLLDHRVGPNRPDLTPHRGDLVFDRGVRRALLSRGRPDAARTRGRSLLLLPHPPWRGLGRFEPRARHRKPAGDSRCVTQLSVVPNQYSAQVASTPAPPRDNRGSGQFAGFRIISYSPDQASIALAASIPGQTDSYPLLTVAMQWYQGDWRAVPQPGPTVVVTGSSATSLAGFVPWSGVS